MTATQDTTLTEALAEQRRQSESAISPDAWEIMQDATADLEARNLADEALREGDTAPTFALPNAVGDTIRLTDTLAEGPVVLSFYRGGWCPYCNLELSALQAHLPEIEALGAQLIAVSPQTPDASLSTAEKHELGFEVLSDAGNEVARRFGLIFQLPKSLREVYDGFGIDLPATNGNASYELPMPATYVLETDGTIRYAFVNPDYTKRADPDAILDAVRALTA